MKFVYIITLCYSFFSCGKLEQVDNLGTGSGSLVPENVQNIFTNECATSGCHAGSSPEAGMNLSQFSAYDDIVSVNSEEQPSLKRVLPFAPDNSYLVKKIEGAPGIDGDRMPGDGPPFLTTAQIDTIRLWISNGALPR
ncbi:hypothetical protein F9K33_05575 [bacterium]|nr:MAG: hypothetical protein F9K33_05575 [bacterium]